MSIQYNQQPSLSLGDSIMNLPVDNSIPSEAESHIVNTLFNTHKTTTNAIMQESKDSFIVGVLIILMSMSQIDQLIKKMLPVTTKSEYILLLVKGMLGALIFWVIKHFYLSRVQP